MPKRLATYSWAVRQALAAREPFTTHGKFRAVLGAPWGTGRLPDPYRSQYLDAWSHGRIAYTVLSYQTPVAWVLDDGAAVIPQVKYSRTKTGHQGLLYALEQPANAFAEEVSRERQAARAGTRERVWAPTRRPGSWDWDRADNTDAAVLSREVPYESGEGAIYTLKYLARHEHTKGTDPTLWRRLSVP